MLPTAYTYCGSAEWSPKQSRFPPFREMCQIRVRLGMAAAPFLAGGPHASSDASRDLLPGTVTASIHNNSNELPGGRQAGSAGRLMNTACESKERATTTWSWFFSTFLAGVAHCPIFCSLNKSESGRSTSPPVAGSSTQTLDLRLPCAANKYSC